jgi:hypothetical protein
MSNVRAVRYRRLALIEQDNEKAKLLQLIADEADRGVLCTSEWLSKPHLCRIALRPSRPMPRREHPSSSSGYW